MSEPVPHPIRDESPLPTSSDRGTGAVGEPISVEQHPSGGSVEAAPAEALVERPETTSGLRRGSLIRSAFAMTIGCALVAASVLGLVGLIPLVSLDVGERVALFAGVGLIGGAVYGLALAPTVARRRR